jgi:16S rRNA (cytosine967-C5)-methyltransferase
MTPLQLAARIVERSDDDTPADMVLRQTLFRRRGLSPADAEWVSRAVFSFFRWFRWLDPARPTEDRVQEAVGLAERFAGDPSSFSDGELIANALPDWVANHVSVTPELVRALQTEPALWLRCRPQFTEETGFRLRDVEPGPLPDSYRYFGSQDLYLDRGFQSGAFEIQDLASQAVGLVCNPRPPEIWWDTCAGEGGKTLHLSSLLNGRSLVWASDRAAWRLDRLRQRAGRARVFNYRAVHWDGGENPPTKTRFDGILVDAPCSGLGTWGRNPHSRWTTTENDVLELSEIQKRILNNVADSLKPGGRLIYSACTFTGAETALVAEWFTNERPEFETEAVMNPFLPDDPPVTEMQLWPQETGGNGMFIAAWRKT